MGRDHLGKPSDTSKGDNTGLRKEMPEEKFEQDQAATDKYTDGNNEVADNIHVRHPNRNTDKDDATNAGGYKQ